MLTRIWDPGLNPLTLRRFLPYVLAGLLASAIMMGWNIAFAQDDPTVDEVAATAATDVGNLTTMMAAFLVSLCRPVSPSWGRASSGPRAQ